MNPGDMISVLPGERISALPGDMISDLPGDMISALPGDMISDLPGDNTTFFNPPPTPPGDVVTIDIGCGYSGGGGDMSGGREPAAGERAGDW